MAVLFFLLTALLGLASAQWNANTAYDRQTIVHLFEWKWTDIADECERFLAPYGFGGVQVSPANEHAVIWNPFRPWWERYQPVSYLLNSRSGSDADFREMVQRCNAVGVRIYVDVVFNHMAAIDGTGSGGSSYSASSLNYPAVPYSSWDFNGPSGNCHSGSGEIDSYQDVNQVRNCDLVGLKDLDTSKDYVRQSVADFLNELISIGVAGFRVDACKHMWPGDLGAIFGKVNDLNTAYFPSGSRPFVYQEVIDQGGEPITADEYTPYGRVTEFKYGLKLAEGVRGSNQLKGFYNFGEAWGMLADGSAVVFIDNHDNQRGHGGGGGIINFEESRLYKIANAFMLAYPYGFARVMSSFNFHGNTDAGPPSDGSGNTDSPVINSDGTCAGDWMCEHRWRQIRNMVGFRNTAYGEQLTNWWDNGNQQIAFGRGNKAFIAINNDGYTLSETLQTGLPSGVYCDIITGDLDSGSCTGSTVSVDNSGYAYFNVINGEDPVVAIHVDAMQGGDGGDGGGGSDPQPDPSGYQRTVIFIKKQTVSGQDLFIRGGIDHNQRAGCTSDAGSSNCAIPITHNIGGTNSKFNGWKSGDDFLDWYGAESDQSQTAEGTPLVWTTNQAGYSAKVDSDGYGYTSLNTWGDHYWMVDLNMDCDKTENGWFEIKAFLTNGDGWESDRAQGTCGGSVGGTKGYSSGNHFGRCGYISVFEFNSNSCTINSF
ncbi:putative alpha-amylase 4N isoform X2 [Apostichopus japonicus]|uniref:Alpha-amylase n=1 Tax=Stichopus japonicus TaxID=307972 RepID=A0A2G8K484_STIJA|nr:putative alpha-amylase 4N isoform X2 [Apostichopus japonicus]